MFQSKHRGNAYLSHKIHEINWGLVLLISALACVGFATLFSAAGGAISPWAGKQMVRFCLFFFLMIGIALTPCRVWYALAWPSYFAGLFLLVVVEIMGHVGMGAQRWIDLGFMKLQPSELMKIALVMVLARYFHAAPLEAARSLSFLFVAAIIVAAPVCLVLLQPDLGTSLMLVAAGIAIAFMAGAPIWIFAAGAGAFIASIPVAWHFLHDYQKARIMTFLHPESDPLGKGYHIMQSKIAIGSGGVDGKGFLHSTQARLNFLPEKQTDFIFTLWSEEWGLIGGIALLILLFAIMMYGLWISLSCKQNFARYLALGISVNFSLYVFINIAMVMGLIPVVGAPLPLVSYGGTSMLAAMCGFGLMMSAYVYRQEKVRG